MGAKNTTFIAEDEELDASMGARRKTYTPHVSWSREEASSRHSDSLSSPNAPQTRERELAAAALRRRREARHRAEVKVMQLYASAWVVHQKSIHEYLKREQAIDGEIDGVRTAEDIDVEGGTEGNNVGCVVTEVSNDVGGTEGDNVVGAAAEVNNPTAISDTLDSDDDNDSDDSDDDDDSDDSDDDDDNDSDDDDEEERVNKKSEHTKKTEEDEKKTGEEDKKTEEAREEEESVSCSICLDSYEDAVATHALPCRHSFHLQCIRNWLHKGVSKKSFFQLFHFYIDVSRKYKQVLFFILLAFQFDKCQLTPLYDRGRD
jgi:hypothetical protein